MALVQRGDTARFTFDLKGGPGGDIRVLGFTARESISSLYEVDLSLASEDDIAFDDAVAKEACLTIANDEGDRHFHGVVVRFERKGEKGRFRLYRALVVPALRLLSHKSNHRIFQSSDRKGGRFPHNSVPNIVETVLKDAKSIATFHYEFHLQGAYPERDFCVQYGETDFSFLSRLLEEEGIFYGFDHESGKHVVRFGDGTAAYRPIDGSANLIYLHSAGKVPEEETVFEFSFHRGVGSGKATLEDFNFERPDVELKSEKTTANNADREIYDHPGGYADAGRGKTLAETRLQEAIAGLERGVGRSTCPRLLPGRTFKLADSPRADLDREYLLVEVIHRGEQPGAIEEVAAGGGFEYTNRFTGIPSSVVFRPERRTRKPVVRGPHTATVAGPKGDEIYPDKYGRVKVRFHWDRDGKKYEKSSCWIRVSSLFAGGQYGGVFTPRAGHEVVVDFLEGDPDRPLVKGSLRNADHMPPYALPDAKTKSTIKTNSSKGGGGFNEIRFEDAKDSEQIFVHGQRDLDARIENDRKEWVGRDRHLIVIRDKTGKVERDSHGSVSGEEREEVVKDRHRKVGGLEAIEIAGNRSFSVKGDAIEVFTSDESETVTGNLYIKANRAVIEGVAGLCLKSSGNFIAIDPACVTIVGKLVRINEGGSPLSGSAGSPDTPGAPLEAAEADDAQPGKDPARP